jgi:Haloacid dehalogenase-like hydrolase
MLMRRQPSRSKCVAGGVSIHYADQPRQLTRLRAMCSENVRLRGLRHIVDEFDGVLLDQFGVLHDGRQPYPHAIEAVSRLAAAGKHIVVVSNSSRRCSGTLGKLGAMGFNESWFAGAITSGEVAHERLLSRPDAWWSALGHSCLHFTWSSRGRVPLDGLGLQVPQPAPHHMHTAPCTTHMCGGGAAALAAM